MAVRRVREKEDRVGAEGMRGKRAKKRQGVAKEVEEKRKA